MPTTGNLPLNVVDALLVALCIEQTLRQEKLGTPDNPTEWFCVCDYCGVDQDDDNRDDECQPRNAQGLTMENRGEINRTLHEFMGRCWHDFQRVDTFPQPDFVCTKCGSNNSGAQNFDYTSSDSPRWLLEEVVAKLSNPPSQNMWRALAELLEQETGEAHPWIDVFVTATAEQIATACYRVIAEAENGK